MSRVKWMITLLLIGLIVLNVLYVLSGVLHFGVSSIDATAIWLFKAKAFFVAGEVPWTTLQNPAYVYQHPQYPVLLPAVLSGVYFLQGQVNELSVLLLYPLLYTGILWLCYRALRRTGASPVIALALTYFYSMFSPLLAAAGRQHAGEADIVITLIGWIIVTLTQKDHSPTSSWFVMALVMLASQVKMEGVFLIVVLALLPTSKLIKSGQVAIAVIPFLAWTYLSHQHALPADFGFILPSLLEILRRFPIIMWESGRELLKINHWYLFWPVFGLSLWQWPAGSTWVKTLTFPALVGMLGLFYVVYFTTSLDPAQHLSSSFDRVLLQLSPWFFLIWSESIILGVKSHSLTDNV